LHILRDSWRRFGEVLPEMRRLQSAGLVWSGLVLAQIGCLLLGRAVARASPYGALLVQSTFLLCAGGFMYLGFWRQRGVYRERYASQAYRLLFFRFLLPFITAGSCAIVFPVLVEGARFLPPVLAYALAGYLLATMQLIEVRGTEIFWDIEWRAFVYNVFPERGRMVTAGIFHWLRHPVYSAGMRFTVALALLRNTLPAVLCAALLVTGLVIWGTIEERDLRQKDADYAAYRRRVSAFFVIPPLPFWRFLLTGRTQTIESPSP
jgi:protein-S-isoprenylcysteine O-methyltransferase Ste14